MATIHVTPRESVFLFSVVTPPIYPLCYVLCVSSEISVEVTRTWARRSPERDPGDHIEDNIFQSLWQSVKVHGSLKRQIICKWKKLAPTHEHWDSGWLRVALAESKPLHSVLMWLLIEMSGHSASGPKAQHAWLLPINSSWELQKWFRLDFLLPYCEEMANSECTHQT